MDNQLDLRSIALIGRTFEEYSKMFNLGSELLNKENILDVAAGVSSFCAEATAKGYEVTASDRIYALNPDEIEQKCKKDLDDVIKQLPAIASLYVWNFYKDIKSLKTNREKAYRLFIEDFKKNRTNRYKSVEYPATYFKNKQFTISLISHFLLLYEDYLDYDFHKKTILELLRINSKEIRIFPIVNLKGNKSKYVDLLIKDEDFRHLKISIEKVDYEFMKNGNEMIVIAY